MLRNAERDFPHLMSYSVSDSFSSAVHLAAGILDTFPFFLATQKRQSYYTEAMVAGLPSAPYRMNESCCCLAQGVVERLACLGPIGEEFLISVETRAQILAMKYCILLTQ